MRRVTFKTAQQQAQSGFFSRFGRTNLLNGCEYRLSPDSSGLNLNPAYAEQIEAHFAGKPGLPGTNIIWHRHSNHALSSQVCCLNFLAPLMREPELLSKIVGDALSIPQPEMIPVSSAADGSSLFVDFEWTGSSDYLGEWPRGSRAARGANATSADAVVRYIGPEGRCTVLIEWKYTEAYGSPLRDSTDPDKGNRTRVRRYADRLFFPDGPVRNDLGLRVEDFFWEPFYQLARQQMLAYQMQRAREQDADHVTVLHLSPAGNLQLHKVTAPALRKFGDDAFEVFRRLLVQPKDFHSTTIEAAFLPTIRRAAITGQGAEWAGYLLDRYSFLHTASNKPQLCGEASISPQVV